MNGIGSKIQREKGYGHWIWQRISAVFTFFLSIYLTYLITSIGALDYTSAHSFVATPHQGVALCFLIVIGLFHAALGVQMIIEDYIAITRGRRFLPRCRA